MTTNTQPSHGLLLMWALWKLQGTQPLTITLEDAQACQRAFPPSGPALFIDGPGDCVEVRVTSRDDARMRREHCDSQAGTA